ncbi:MAG: gliding motility-associated C-terminal domain-containing protein [Bacteroidota bacterium]
MPRLQTFSLIAIFLSLPFLPLQAQFFLNGNAVQTSDSCYQLTAAVNAQAGSIWNGDLIDLSQSFELYVDVFLGCQDDLGADGLVFGLQPISTSIGGSGGAIGFGDVEPSLGVEFDTFQNLDFDDPAFDHITIVQDGVLNHTLPGGALAGPVQADANDINIEDCAFHPVRIAWDANGQTLEVYYDCELRLSYNGDIVNEIFDGDPFVFWGFTSATGGLNNIHEVCFNYTTFLSGLADQTICPGESVALEAGGGSSYLWSPANGLSATDIPNPIATPTETTLYTVEILDDCGVPFFEEVLITVDNNQFEVELSIDPPSTTVIPGDQLNIMAEVSPVDTGNYIYSWTSNNGSTYTHPDSSATGVTASLSYTGTEDLIVSITNENGCTIDTAFTIEIQGTLYDIPNIFSPNGDRLNDQFGLLTHAEPLDYECQIYNRFGELVFSSTNYQELWDGRQNEEEAPSDVYYFRMTFSLGGEPFEESGELTLLR